jgi:hypothetical protein
VVFDIASRLAELRGNFVKRVSLGKEEAQSFTLILRERCKYPLQTSLPALFIDRFFKLTRFGTCIRELACHFVQVKAGVEMTGGQVTATRDGTAVSHLENPRLGRAFGTVKAPAVPVNQKKNILDEIIRFARSV